MSKLDLIVTPQPHFIPGYAGYCPQYIFRVGDTYGECSHKCLVQPNIQHSENLVLSDRTVDEYYVWRPSKNAVDCLKSRSRNRDTVYQHPFKSGYEGFVPRLNNHFGQNYTVNATEAVSEFEKIQQKERRDVRNLKILGAAQDDEWDPKTLEDRTLIKTQYKIPLIEVRPEGAGILRKLAVTEAPLEPPISSHIPHFMDMSSPVQQKSLKKGYCGHVPFGYPHFGKSNEQMTNSALCDFTSNYRHRQSSEWAPVTISRPDPPYLIQPTELYHKHVGMLPNYSGHVPGVQYRCGRSFGAESRDAKRWLRGDFRLG